MCFILGWTSGIIFSYSIEKVKFQFFCFEQSIGIDGEKLEVLSSDGIIPSTRLCVKENKISRRCWGSYLVKEMGYMGSSQGTCGGLPCLRLDLDTEND